MDGRFSATDIEFFPSPPRGMESETGFIVKQPPAHNLLVIMLLGEY